MSSDADAIAAWCIETIVVFFSFVQVASMYEIIDSYDRPQEDDSGFLYLMCAGLFVGQTADCRAPFYIIVTADISDRYPLRLRMVSLIRREAGFLISCRVRECILLYQPSKIAISSLVRYLFLRHVRPQY